MSRDLTLTVNIVAQPPTVLKQVAQSMVAGQWLQLTGANKPANIDAALSTDWGGDVFVWGSRVRWNPVLSTIEYCGGGSHAASRLYGRYVEATNSFETWPQQSPEFGGADYRLGTHTYDRLTVNPYTGKIWQGSHTGQVGPPVPIFTFDSGPKSVWADYRTGNPITFSPGGTNIFAPMDWWSEPSTIPGAGAQGLLIITTTGGASIRVQGYNPLTNTWPFDVIAPNSSGHNYDMIGIYSKTKNVYVFGCSNNLPFDLFRLSSDGTVTKYGASGQVPFGFGADMGTAVWADDPTTGNFLVTNGVNSSLGRFWQFNPDGAGTWTQLPDLPSGMHWATTPGQSSVLNTAVAAAIYGSAYNGVVAYLCGGPNYARMWLYKHA